MLALFENIATIIYSVVNFVITSLASLIVLFLEIPQQLAFLTSSLSVLPPFVLPFATASISISVLLFVLNRRVD